MDVFDAKHVSTEMVRGLREKASEPWFGELKQKVKKLFCFFLSTGEVHTPYAFMVNRVRSHMEALTSLV
jgi:hypothetical protein